MTHMGLGRVIRGKGAKTTNSDTDAECPLDHVKRQFRAQRPNQLGVADFTYVLTWQGSVYVAFVLDALEQALCARRPAGDAGLIHHSDRGSQYLSIRYSDRLGEAGVVSAVLKL